MADLRSRSPLGSAPGQEIAAAPIAAANPLVPLSQAAIRWALGRRSPDAGASGWAGGRGESEHQRQGRLERELEEARRLGHWFTEEDRQLVREHEARLVAERRGELVRRGARSGTQALLVLACVVPLLWPVALVAALKVFPRTSRRLALGLLALSGGTFLAAGVLVVQLGRQLSAPDPTSTPALSAATQAPQAAADASSSSEGASIARRLLQACDYWVPQATSEDGSLTFRKGLYQSWQGRRVMVLPRATWTVLSRSQRSALTQYLLQSGEAAAIHVGTVRPAASFAGNSVEPQELVWSAGRGG